MIKKALLVGINRYSGSPLRGCLNDVVQMRDLLAQTFGFHDEHIRVIEDERATGRAIEDGLRWLATSEPGSDDGDVRVFHYSGHGSYQADQNEEEPDGTDECLVPVDYLDEGMLIDDDLGKIYDLFPAGSNLTLIMDCCHSGTIQRDPRRDIVFRFLPVSDDEKEKIEGARRGYAMARKEFITAQLREMRDLGALDDAELERRVERMIDVFERRRSAFGDVKCRENNVLLSGCKSTQTSADAHIAGDYHGAFTYYLVDAVSRLGPRASYYDVLCEVGRCLTRNGYEQIPQLEGLEERTRAPLFSSFGASAQRKAA